MEAKLVAVNDFVAYNRNGHYLIGKVSFLSEAGHILLKFINSTQENTHTNILNVRSIPLSVKMIEDMGATRINYIINNKPIGALRFTLPEKEEGFTLIRCDLEGFFIPLDDYGDDRYFLIEEMSYLPVEYVQTLQQCLRNYGLTDIANDCYNAVFTNALI